MTTLSPRADVIAVLEAVHAPASSDAAWAEGIVAAMKPLFPRAALVGSYALEFDASFELRSTPFAVPREMVAMVDHARSLTPGNGTGTWVPFHFGRSVITQREAIRALDPSVARKVHAFNDAHRTGDGVGIIAHPVPGHVIAVNAIFEEELSLTKTERLLLTRIANHIEAGHRVRLNDAAILAEVDGRGNVHSPSLHAHVARISEARSLARRRSPDAPELWTGLLEGRMSVVPRGDRYLVLDNPTPSHELRALKRTEVAVLSLAARGASSKEIVYALGVSPALVSASLQSAAAKIGVLTRTELVRLAALLTQNPKGLLDDANLTTSEAEVLTLLERGLDNKAIATIRMRSVRTIANQVASLLRKTGSSSRRELVARSAGRR